MGNFKIGWAEETLVPDKKVSLTGQFFERISEYVESEITVTAMAIEADGHKAILCSADLTGFNGDMMALTRKNFAELCPELDPRILMVAVTHTHCSLTMQPPSATGVHMFNKAEEILNKYLPEEKRYTPLVTPDPSVQTPEEGALWAAQQIAKAAAKAWQNRKEALYANEFGRAAVGMCRRVSYDDGSGQMWGDVNTANFVALEGGNDSGIELLYMFDTNKKLTGVVANIACPSQILEQRSFISADFWGRAKALIREKLGEDIYLLALGGAGGDQCPRDLIRWVDPETPIDDPNVNRPHLLKRKADPSMYDISGCNRAGKRIAHEILDIFEEITEYKSEAPFVHEIIDLDLPLRKATMAEYENADREIRYYVEKHKDKERFNFEDKARIHVHAGTMVRFEEQQFTETHPIEYHVMRFGDVAFATNPFELFLDYGNRMKARSYAQQTFIVQLCCGSSGYLPTEKAEKAGHYSAYISSGKVGHEGGDLLVRDTLKHINKLFEEEVK